MLVWYMIVALTMFSDKLSFLIIQFGHRSVQWSGCYAVEFDNDPAYLAKRLIF